MKKTANINSKNHSTLISIVLGILLMVLLSLVGTIIGASIINGGKVTETAYKIIASAVWLVTSFLGCLLAGKLAGKQILLVCLACAVGYIAVLFAIQIMFLDSNFSEIWMAIILCAVGAIPAILLNIRNKTGNTRKKRFRYS